MRLTTRSALAVLLATSTIILAAPIPDPSTDVATTLPFDEPPPIFDPPSPRPDPLFDGGKGHAPSYAYSDSELHPAPIPAVRLETLPSFTGVVSNTGALAHPANTPYPPSKGDEDHDAGAGSLRRNGCTAMKVLQAALGLLGFVLLAAGCVWMGEAVWGCMVRRTRRRRGISLRRGVAVERLGLLNVSGEGEKGKIVRPPSPAPWVKLPKIEETTVVGEAESLV